MGKKTPLYQCHLMAKGKMVDFAGWDMPLHYGSQVEEHHIVRNNAGVFDVSHMTIVDCEGLDAAAFLRRLLANNIDRLVPGKALYTCMLTEEGGVIDDLIVYKISDDFFRLIVNSGTHDKDLAWLTKQAAAFTIKITERTDLAMLAIQGPKVKQMLAALFKADYIEPILNLKPFHAISRDHYFIARTGYTGEEGLEVILPAQAAPSFWESLMKAGVKPCGLGARDTLRLEAGLNLYGSDMDETVSPLESNLGWTIAWDPAERDFIGREALVAQKQAGDHKILVGLILEGPGVLRNHQKVIVNGLPQGEITSGSFSPTLNKGIALARVPRTIGATCEVEMRGKLMKAQVIKPPFLHQGKINKPITQNV